MDEQIVEKILQQQKIGEHVSCGYSMSTIWAFDNMENNHTLYGGEDCMKHFVNL